MLRGLMVTIMKIITEEAEQCQILHPSSDLRERIQSETVRRLCFEARGNFAD